MLRYQNRNRNDKYSKKNKALSLYQSDNIGIALETSGFLICVLWTSNVIYELLKASYCF